LESTSTARFVTSLRGFIARFISQDKDAKARPPKVLLELEILVGGEEQIETGSLGLLQQAAIAKASPAFLLHRTHLMPDEERR
jgi:hypothetical protein